VGYALLSLLARRSLIAIPHHRVPDAMLWLIGGTIVGGRVGYAIVYDPALFTGFHATPPWWDLLALHKGGMASHGGMVGLALAAWRISRGWFDRDTGLVQGRSTWPEVADALSLVAPFGIVFGRIANFINGELLGAIVARPGEPAPWWAVRFPQELVSGHAPALSPQQATQLDALMLQAANAAGATVGTASSLSRYALLDWIVANADKLRPQLEPLLSARHPSQLYQALGEGVLVALVVWTIAARRVRAGLVAGAWIVTYGIARIITEFYRLPDTQFAVQRPWGLSRGQWLSVGMVVIGLALIFWVLRRKDQPARHLGWLAR
jgi:phosphatidylglycerol:prolipoprotein diacylglycerol transferase